LPRRSAASLTIAHIGSGPRRSDPPTEFGEGYLLPTPAEWRQVEPLLRLYERGLTLTEFEEMPPQGHA
jgi:hypothetical protein